MSRIGITLSNPNFTGSCKMARLYAQALVAAGHEVLVLHGPEQTANDQTDDRASFISALKEDGIQTVLVSQLASLISADAIQKTAAQATRFGADCLIGFQQRDRSIALKTAASLEIPGLISFQNHHHFHGRWPLPFIKERIYSHIIKKHLKLGICTSPAVQEELTNRFRVPAEKTCVIYNGVEVENFPQVSAKEKQQVREEFGIGPDELMLLNVGRIDPQKGLNILVQAVNKVTRQLADNQTNNKNGASNSKRIKLVQVGDVIDSSHKEKTLQYYRGLQTDLKQFGLEDSFQFAGWRDDCPRLLGAADIYVHSALWEGWPLSVVEAMGARLPTIQTDCCGIPQHFEQGKHGYIVPREDSEALAKAMLQLISASPEERQQMGLAGHEFAVEYFNIKKNSARFVQLIENSLN